MIFLLKKNNKLYEIWLMRIYHKNDSKKTRMLSVNIQVFLPMSVLP
jgi:hypothetical protein